MIGIAAGGAEINEPGLERWVGLRKGLADRDSQGPDVRACRRA